MRVLSVKSFSDKSQSNPVCLQRGKWGNQMTCYWAWILLALTFREWPSSRAKFPFPTLSGVTVGTRSLPWCLSVRQPFCLRDMLCSHSTDPLPLLLLGFAFHPGLESCMEWTGWFGFCESIRNAFKYQLGGKRAFTPSTWILESAASQKLYLCESEVTSSVML